MRAIKFRAWDKRNNRMINSEDILNVDFRFREIEYMLRTETFAITFEEADIMQYTGLKDKNGQEIYEGDIIFSECGERIYLEISFWTGKFIALYNNFVLELFDLNEKSYIAGNVFENAELLELQNMPF